MRWASMVLPVPGGPTMSRLCEPAAAIVIARLTASCPRTSAKSYAGDSFDAGFLACFLKGGSIRDSARAGIAAGTRAVSGVGGTGAFER